MINVEPKFKFIMFKNISLIRLYPQTYFVNYSFLCSIIPPVTLILKNPPTRLHKRQAK